MSCWNRSCQWERYPTRSPRERPSLNVTPARYQGRHRGRSSLRMHGKLQAEVAALDTRGPSMCYKTKWLAYRTTSSKMKFRFASFGERFTVQEHSLCWVFFFCFILNVVGLRNNQHIIITNRQAVVCSTHLTSSVKLFVSFPTRCSHPTKASARDAGREIVFPSSQLNTAAPVPQRAD